MLGRREQTSLKYQKTDQEASLVAPLSTNSPPPLLLTDKQKSEPAGLAAVYSLPSLLYPSLFSSCGGEDCWLGLICVHVCERICVCYLVCSQLSLQEAIVFQTQSTDDLGLEKTKYICEHLSLNFNSETQIFYSDHLFSKNNKYIPSNKIYLRRINCVFVIVFLVFVALTF